MTAKLIEEALLAWREGERLLDELSDRSADREQVRLAVVRLRRAYRDLTAASAEGNDVPARQRTTVEAAHETIRRVRARQAEPA